MIAVPVLALFGCPGPVAQALPPRPVVTPAEVEEPEPLPVPGPPAAPPGGRTGRQPGPAVLASPVVRWSRVLGGPVTEPLSTDGENIFAVADETVHCLDFAGRELWAMRVGASSGVAATDQGPVVGTATGRLLVLDARDGSTVRSTISGGRVRGVPAQLAGAVAWVTVHGAVASTAGWGFDAAISTAGALAVDGERWWLATLEGALVAGEGAARGWQVTLPAPAADGPLLDDTRVYVPLAAHDGAAGGVIAFDREGRELWRRQTDFGPAAPLALGRQVFLPDKDGHLYALDPATGAVIWDVAGFGEYGMQPAIVGESIYAGNGDGSLAMIDAFDGGVVWTVSLGAPVTGEPVVARGLLVVGLANGRVVALGEP